MPLVLTRMDLQIVRLSEVGGELPCDLPYVQNLKRKGTNEFIYKTDSQT